MGSPTLGVGTLTARSVRRGLWTLGRPQPLPLMHLRFHHQDELGSGKESQLWGDLQTAD